MFRLRWPFKRKVRSDCGRPDLDEKNQRKTFEQQTTAESSGGQPHEQIQSAVNHLNPDSDLGEIELVLFQLARLDFGPADDPLLNYIRKCRAEDEILHSIKRSARVSMRVLRAALVCQQERVARHRRKMEGSATK